MHFWPRRWKQCHKVQDRLYYYTTTTMTNPTSNNKKKENSQLYLLLFIYSFIMKEQVNVLFTDQQQHVDQWRSGSD